MSIIQWQPFFQRDDKGHLIEAGVDAVHDDGDTTNVCVTTIYAYDPADDAERLEIEKPIISDSHLLAAAKEMLAELERLVAAFPEFDETAEEDLQLSGSDAIDRLTVILLRVRPLVSKAQGETLEAT